MRTARRAFTATTIAAALMFVSMSAAAQNRPANATARCKDGSYSTATTKQGACSDHGGIDTWFADSKSGTKSAAKETKEDAKAAGKATKDTAKDVGKTAKEGAKTGARAAKEGAGAAKDSTKTVAKPADAPADATAKCKDGSYSFATEHRGACSGHGGVSAWYK